MVKCCCLKGAEKAVGLAILAFCLGTVVGMFCPIKILAIIELALLLILGHLCLFKW